MTPDVFVIPKSERRLDTTQGFNDTSEVNVYQSYLDSDFAYQVVDDASVQFEGKAVIGITGEGYDGIRDGFGIAEEEVCVADKQEK